jgi:glycosyltransferase involved in cell wall biosynthesis
VTVSLRSLPLSRMMLEDEIEPRVREQMGYLRATTVETAPVAIRHIILHNHHYAENVICPPGARMARFEDELNVYRSTIVYTSWERSTVHPELVVVLNRCGRVWVPCDMNARVFRNAGVKNVDVIPCPFAPDMSPTAGIAAPRGSELVPSGKRFYAIGKWEPRKNYDALIGAFLLAFKKRDRASLFLKTSEWGAWKDYPSPAESVAKWLSDPGVLANGWTRENYAERLRLVTTKLPEEKLTAIHRTNNIYVTCSHGEAWDLPAFDAKVAGNALVYTGWGGAEDYCEASDTRIHPDGVTLTAVHPGYGWEPLAEWAECRLPAIQDALLRATPPEVRVQPPAAYGLFGERKAGDRMRSSLLNMCAEGAFAGLSAQGSFG